MHVQTHTGLLKSSQGETEARTWQRGKPFQRLQVNGKTSRCRIQPDRPYIHTPSQPPTRIHTRQDGDNGDDKEDDTITSNDLFELDTFKAADET